MTATQAERLGNLIREQRVARGLAVRELATAAEVAAGWVAGIEAGRFLDPAPERLARLAEALDLPVERIDTVTQGALADGLPAGRTYFRAKYGLTPEQAAQVERYVARLRKDAA